LLILLSRSFSGILPRPRQIGRALMAAVAAGLAATLVVEVVPLSDPVVSILGSTLGALVALPFIWPELRQLTSL